MEACNIALSDCGSCIPDAFDFKKDENFMLRSRRQTRQTKCQIVLKRSDRNKVRMNHGNKCAKLNEDLDFFLIWSLVVRLEKMHLDACTSEWVAKLPTAYCTFTKADGGVSTIVSVYAAVRGLNVQEATKATIRMLFKLNNLFRKYINNYKARDIKHIYTHSCTLLFVL